MLRKIGYGIVVWAVPYVTALQLMGLMFSDRVAFQTIMVVEGAVVGTFLACLYFRPIHRRFLREGVVLALTWIAVSWALDFVALVPFADMTAWRYFVEIGFRYLGILAPTVAIGYVLHERLERPTRAAAAMS
jgi:hypothetical protein